MNSSKRPSAPPPKQQPEVQPKQYGSGIVNIVGVNNMASSTAPLPTGLQPQAAPPPIDEPTPPQFSQIEDITGQKFDQLVAQSEQRYSAVKEAINSQHKIRESLAQTKGVPGRQMELAAIFDTVANAGLAYYGIQEERKLKKLQAEQENAALMVERNFYESMIEVEDNIRQYGDEHGVNTLESDIHAIMETPEFRALPVEQQREVSGRMYESLYTYKKTQTQAHIQTQTEIQNAQINLVKSQLDSETRAYIARAANPALPAQDRHAVIDEGANYILSNTADFDEVTRFTILAEYYADASEATHEAETGSIRYAQKQYDIINFIPQAEEARVRFGDDVVGYRQWLAANAPDSIASEALQLFPDSRTIATDNMTYEERVNGYIDAQRARENARSYDTALENPETITRAVNTVWKAANNDTDAQAYIRVIQSKKPEQRTPTEALVLSMYEEYNTNRQTLFELRSEVQQAYRELDASIIRFAKGQEPQTTTYTDSETGQSYRLILTDPNTGEVVYARSDISQVTIDSWKNEINDLNLRIQELSNTTATGTGVDILNPANPAFRDGIIRDINTVGNPALRNELRQEVGMPPEPGVQQPGATRPNFNGSTLESMSGQPPVRNLAVTVDGSPMPFTQARENEITISSEYGNRVHPIHGDVRFHDGLDFASESMYTEDVGALAIQGGVVVSAEPWSGYGGTVIIQTPQGYLEQYSHLRSFHVKAGEVIAPGEVVGIVGGDRGDPMAGSSTGRHLHFTVYRPGTTNYTSDDLVNPTDYLAQVPVTEYVPRGTGSNGTEQAGAMPTANALPAPGGNLLSQTDGDRAPYLAAFLRGNAYSEAVSTQVPAEVVYPDASQPVPSGVASRHKEDYTFPNDPSRNYQYDVLARDHEFRVAVAEVSDYIGIPAQWLVDLMAYETGHTFDPGEQGPQVCDESGCYYGIGLIQIMTFNLDSWGMTPAQVAGMSRAEYTRTIVKRYLEPWKGQLNTIEDLSSVIFTGSLGGSGSASDGYNSMSDYNRSLGSGVGRRYGDDAQSSALHAIHDEYIEGCPICSQQYARFNQVVPHEAVA